MKKVLGMLLFCSLLAWSADFKPAKLLELRDASEVGANTVSDSSEGLSGAPKFVPAMLERCRVTISLEGTNYSAIFPDSKHLRITDFNLGDSIPARIEGNKLVIKTLDGKILKSKIVNREDAHASTSEK